MTRSTLTVMGNRILRPALLAAGAVFCLAAPAGAAKTTVTWTVTGGGWGHGVGMSAYGAYGYSKHGYDHEYILSHYYPGTRIATIEQTPKVKVLIKTASGSVVVSGAATACGKSLAVKGRYRLRNRGGRVELVGRNGRRAARCGATGEAVGAPIVTVDGASYRGSIVVTASGQSGLNVVNRLSVNDYLKGAMSAEVPPSWPSESLKAFAIAMRSIALTVHAGGSLFDLYPDTRTQMYKGVAAEYTATNSAIAATRNRVVQYRGKTIQATYFSCSGGRTESSFPGGPKVPYLKSVDDPFDYYAPLHSWRFTFTDAKMNSLLAPYLKGKLKAIKVTKRGDSPRILEAVVLGTKGSTTVTGSTLRSALGIYGRWAYFKRVEKRR